MDGSSYCSAGEVDIDIYDDDDDDADVKSRLVLID